MWLLHLSDNNPTYGKRLMLKDKCDLSISKHIRSGYNCILRLCFQGAGCKWIQTDPVRKSNGIGLWPVYTGTLWNRSERSQKESTLDLLFCRSSVGSWPDGFQRLPGRKRRIGSKGFDLVCNGCSRSHVIVALVAYNRYIKGKSANELIVAHQCRA